ncbi:hypothetical protein TRIATDRAFT_46482 [Trichoderma atroviride IMI 206040]|uniref:Aminoglycoside phosphotransferase domain-containing protein n=2 Tax=Hypocrea atroviridis TaxID=63577 RepID=G9NPY1_HYPAI|nr:uncharacterized protein TRIATDRAFT_46482 [Trichoderma atroviride IMI 206040]EHK47134.1 hypothetical protein TRIATDRAFT_46482 [Trichoderma atroviride IMI 206040]
MDNAALEAGRLSPVVKRQENDCLVTMEGLNPERARRLLAPRSPSMSPNNVSVGPRKTGSNNIALGRPGAQKSTGIKKECSPSRPPLMRIPKPASPVVAGAKRPRDHLDEPQEPHLRRQWPPNSPVFLSPPPPNPHIVYLESLLQPHCLLLTLRSRLGDGSQALSTQYRSVTKAGLLLGEAIQSQLDLPILRLPAPAKVIGGLEGTIEGEFLEDIWYNLTPQAKYSYARQLRHVLNSMRLNMAQTRSTATPQAKGNMLGSAFAGPFSLMLDQHAHQTYWAVHPKPTCEEFVAFLTWSFVASVPASVAAAVASQFRSDHAVRFTHGELSPKNIVVRNSKIVCILGWDRGGWYPEWWEYVKFFEARTGPENQDWYDYATHIFVDTFQTELAAYQGIARCQSS